MIGVRGEKIPKSFKRSVLTIEQVQKLLKKAEKLATNSIKNGMSIEVAQLILRYRDVSTTMIYIHSLDRENNNGEIIMSDLLF